MPSPRRDAIRNESLQTGRQDGVDVARREDGGVHEETWVRDERPEQRVCQGVWFCRGEKQAGWVSAQEAGHIHSRSVIVAAASSRRGLRVGL